MSSVHYAVEGGIANLTAAVTIEVDGRATRERGGTPSPVTLEPGRAEAIRAALDQSGLFDRSRRYPAPPGGADLRRYEITYRGATVVAFDTTVPAELQDALRMLEAVVNAVP